MKSFSRLFLGIAILAGAALGESDESAPARFQSFCADLAAKAGAGRTMAVPGKEGWLFLAAELRHLGAGAFWGDKAAQVSRSAKPENADPLPAILDFNAQLQSIGVKLLLVPVPAKAAIYPDMLPGSSFAAGETPRLDAADRNFFDLLKTNGVPALDLAPYFLANRRHPDGALYCRQDSHWSGNGCVLAAQQIASALHGLQDINAAGRSALTSAWEEVEISGDLWRSLNDAGIPKERLRLRRVGREAVLEPLPPDDASPVVLLGDSHNLVFHGGDDMLARGAGLPDQLALALGFPVDLVAVRGSGATPARINLLRRVQKNPDYWRSKKIVIWCFAAREFTESDGWRKVPIAP